ncbi:nucleolar protein 14 homolog l(3)07882 [Anticarsia gemmatalis]|uniref:nucleolar protein 14 homolog l(3)07882 n=1 Tax=Anticarsia gemmatalis TaxID=129554 RepID=UPI003F776A82
MAKVKNKRNSGLADKVHNKRKTDVHKKKLNPFEVHINREKLKVLGKKSKHDRGLPGVSRAKAIQKRKETLGTEMKLMNKTNAFIDRRIGEKDTQLSAEDRMIARFAAERQKQHNKKNIYNLAEDEILTHRGQTLEQIEKFDDPRSDDEEDEDGRKFGGLGDDFVSEGHFGGGMLSKTDSKDGAKSHKDLIEQLIAESKKRKAEKQKEKEQTLDLTEKLDSEWKDLQPVVFKKMRRDDKEESAIDKLLNKAENKSFDYDKMMRELRFEKRGTPSDGLKNDEKQAKEEQERLAQLEKEREQRMLGEDERIVVKTQQAKTKHRSAEDLDDNFELDDEKDFMLAYDKDGKPLVPENVLKDFSVPNAKPKFEDGISDTSDEEDEEDEGGESEETEEEQETKETNKKTSQNKSDSENENSDQNHDSSDDDSSDEEETKSKSIKNKQYSAKLERNKKKDESILFSKEVENAEESASNKEDSEESGEEEESDEEEENVVDLNDLKDLKESDVESEDDMADDGEKIEKLFDFKNNEGDKLKELLTGKTPSQQATAVQKLIKSYDPSLSENNKDKLSRLFAHMLQYINDIFTQLTEESDILKSFLIFDKLAPYFYDLAHTNKVSTKKYIVELLKEKYGNFKKRQKRVPDMDTLIFFKLISLLYPTSDFRHPVTTPALIFMSEILTLSRFNDAYSISRGLFITTLILEYTTLSKRLVPPAINFLRGVLYLSANTSVLNPIQVVPPFRLHKDAKILNLDNDCSKMDVGKMAAKGLVQKEIDDEFKIKILMTSMGVLKEFFDYFNDIEAQLYLFEPHLKLTDRIDFDLYPKKVGKTLNNIVQYMRSSLEVKTFTPLCREKPRPKALRLYEPDIQEVFTGSKSAKLSREQAESQRLKTKYKKEMKGALREIRRDKSYIASVKIRQKIQSDNIRKDKVKQIYKDAAIQQGELNKMKRMK